MLPAYNIVFRYNALPSYIIDSKQPCFLKACQTTLILSSPSFVKLVINHCFIFHLSQAVLDFFVTYLKQGQALDIPELQRKTWIGALILHHDTVLSNMQGIAIFYNYILNFCVVCEQHIRL